MDMSAQAKAAERTIEWARRCKEAHKNTYQQLYAITQGGVYSDLRRKSAEELMEIDFDGYAIGGLSIGESKDVMHKILKEQSWTLPEDKPRYLMGVGSPIDLMESISYGVDIFDSTFPTRNARHNDAYTLQGDMNISRGKFKSDSSPIEVGCGCYTCLNHSKAYIHHLLRNHETTGQSLMTIHNLFFINRLLGMAKEAISKNNFMAFIEEFKEKYLQGERG
jgi:queuine tRNA-ribosyltransferase